MGCHHHGRFLQVPPGLRMNMTTFLHGSTVAHVPLFRGLSGNKDRTPIPIRCRCFTASAH